MTVIVDKNMVIKGTGKTTVSSPYLPTEGLLFTRSSVPIDTNGTNSMRISSVEVALIG